MARKSTKVPHTPPPPQNKKPDFDYLDAVLFGKKNPTAGKTNVTLTVNAALLEKSRQKFEGKMSAIFEAALKQSLRKLNEPIDDIEDEE